MNTQRELEINAIKSICKKIYINGRVSTNFKPLDNINTVYRISKSKYNSIIETELDRGGFSNLSKLIIKQTIDERLCK
jgi:hypothetical protein